MNPPRFAATGLYLLLLAACATLVLAGGPADAQTSTWNGTTNDWNAASNWNPVGVPTATTAVVIKDVGAAPTVTSSTSCQSITFNTVAADQSIFANTGQTLTVVSAITMAAGATGTDTFSLPGVSTGSLLFGTAASNASLTVTNNSVVGGQLVFSLTTVLGNAGSGGVTFSGPGQTTFSGTFAASPNNVVGGLTKFGPGQLDYSGSGATLTGNLTLIGGLLNLDYSSSTTSKVQTSGSSQLVLDGGTLMFVPNASTPATQSFPNGTSLIAGHSDVVASGAGTVTFNAGAITRSAGATVDFSPSASAPTFSIQTSTINSNGLLGLGPAFATINGGTNWAVQSGGVAIAGLAGFSTNIYASNDNTDVTANANPAAFTTNSLRFNVPNLSVGLTGTNMLQSGGILVTPSGGGGQITGASATLVASGGEMIVHQYSTDLFTIGAALSATAGLTKTGPGTLTLSGNNTGLTGPINVNRGSLTVSGQTAAVNSASAINFNDDRTGPNNYGGLQALTVALPNGTSGAITPPIRLSAFSASDYGTYFSSGTSTGTTVTLSGVISSAPGLTTPIRFTNDSSNTGQFNLTNTNTFLGNVSLDVGSLGITADANLGNSANQLFLEVGSATAGGLVFLNGGITVARPVVLTYTTRVVSNGSDSNTISGLISGPGGLVKDGTGTLTLSNATNLGGGMTVSGGTLSLGTSGSFAGGSNITVAAGATFTPGSTSAQSVAGVLTLNGGTYRVSSASAISQYINSIVTGPTGGTIDLTGAANTFLLKLAGSNFSSITVNGNSTWLSPANTAVFFDPFLQNDFPINIAVGVTLNNGIAFSGGADYRIIGGGTLFQNSDATNVVGMTAAIIVSQSRFRVMNASSNGGVGNLGTGTFLLDGGTFAYGGSSATTTHPIGLTANGGTIEIESAATTLTANGAITLASIPELAGLTKIGSGTLFLGNAANSFSSLTINAGTVQTANDNTLGGGLITINPGGTLSYTGPTSTSTTRTININSGTLFVGGGMTLTLNGATVNGGFLRGGPYAVAAGASLNGETTFTSTTINQTGPGSYTNFTNGGTLTIANDIVGAVTMNGFNNGGSASITVGARTPVSVVDFQSYGTLTINPANITQGFTQTTLVTNNGTTPLNFNGGSLTFVGTPSTAVFPPGPQQGQPTFVAGIDLKGKNAIVVGGLFVNNGYIEDSSNGFTGTATIVANFGALVKGAGFFQNSVVTQNGGKFQAGNSPGSASFGSFILGPGGVASYVFAIDDATGAPGPIPDVSGHVSGWGLVKAISQITGAGSTPGDFTWTATPADKLLVSLQTLVNPATVGVDVPGMMDHFDPTRSYVWPAVEWNGAYAGPADDATLDGATTFDTTGFANPIGGRFGWSLDTGTSTLSLTYTPSAVPEPGTLAFVGLAALGLAARRLRRKALSA
jgi:autotransporter-associated beta strand protein